MSTLDQLARRYKSAPSLEEMVRCGWYRTLSSVFLSAELPTSPAPDGSPRDHAKEVARLVARQAGRGRHAFRRHAGCT